MWSPVATSRARAERSASATSLCRGQGVFMANKQAEDVARPQRIDRQNGEQAARKIAGKRHDHASKPMGGDGVAHMQAKGLP